MPNDSPASIIYNNLGSPVGTILDGVLYRLQVESKVAPNTTFQTNQIDVDVTSIQIAGTPISNRKLLIIKSLKSNSNNIFIGSLNSVTSLNGYELIPGESLSINIDGTSQVWAISDVGINRLSYIEIS